MNIADNLRNQREKQRLTQLELGTLVGVSQSMIAQLERGTKTLTVPLTIIMADVLHCSVLDIIGVDK